MEKFLFGKTPDGKEVYAYTFGNDFVKATILGLGGIIHKLEVGGTDIVASYGSVEGNIYGAAYRGALIGRYANRIADGKFTLNGKEYGLAKNERGVNHLHGGNVGFNKRIFDVTQIVEKDTEKLVLTYFSPDGEEGYPGNLDVTVTYAICNNDFSISYKAKSDADTYLNMTNHAYFNLNGYDSGSMLDHTLQIFADRISVVNENLIPISQMEVAGTPFDFNEPKKVGRDINADDALIKIGGGYDHNYFIKSNEQIDFCGNSLLKTAVVKGEKLEMQLYTDYPCVQLFTANGTGDTFTLKADVKQCPRHALCLETQYEPNSPSKNQALLLANEVYNKTALFRFNKL